MSDINEEHLSEINEEELISLSISWGDKSTSTEDTLSSPPLLQDTASKPSLSMIPSRLTYAGERGGISPPLTPSLFPSLLPPTIHFPLPHEKCKTLFNVKLNYFIIAL